MSEPELVEDFFGVYLLYCLNPRYKGRTYIGYTRDPNRRIKQHNKGSWAGGAQRTSNRGPWKMVLIIHGFPNNISALRFEWAWQNPNKTIRLQHLNLRKIPRKETVFKFKLRVLSEMLRVGPWCRLPLLIRWLENEYFEEFRDERKPPDHMIICHGPVKSRNLKKKKSTESATSSTECLLCSRYITNGQVKLTCLNPNCELLCHISCLADLFLTPGEYVPIVGSCPFCGVKLKWGDLIRKMKGCGAGDVNAKGDDSEKDDESVDDNESYTEKGIVVSDDDSYSDDLQVGCDENNYDLDKSHSGISIIVNDNDRHELSATNDQNPDGGIVVDGDDDKNEGENKNVSDSDDSVVYFKEVEEQEYPWMYDD